MNVKPCDCSDLSGSPKESMHSNLSCHSVRGDDFLSISVKHGKNFLAAATPRHAAPRLYGYLMFILYESRLYNEMQSARGIRPGLPCQVIIILTDD